MFFGTKDFNFAQTYSNPNLPQVYPIYFVIKFFSNLLIKFVREI